MTANHTVVPLFYHVNNIATHTLHAFYKIELLVRFPGFPRFLATFQSVP